MSAVEIEDGVIQLQEQSSETVLWLPQLPSASRAQYPENDPSVMSSLCLMGGIEGCPPWALSIWGKWWLGEEQKAQTS